MIRSLTLGAAAPVLALSLSAPTQAPGLPPTSRESGRGVLPATALRIESTRIEARVEGQTATTLIRQVFDNPTDRIQEADWLLPLAEGATADDFTMTVGGVKMEGDVLDAGRARGIYEAIVRRRRDPGLLEFVGRGCLRARVFPIPVRGKVEVEVRIRQLLEDTAGMRRWSFPLRGLDAGGLAVDSGVLDVKIHCDDPVQTVYSPLAGVDIIRPSRNEARLSVEWSDGRLPDRDLEVFYALEERDFGVEVLTSRADDKDGYFMLSIAPKREWDEDAIPPRDVRIAVDTSGSMKGEKIAQARNALRYFVESLRPVDRFDIVTFATEAESFFGGSVPADEANRKRALERIADLDARGGTNLEDALRRSLARASGEDAAELTLTVLVTDGLPSVGRSRPDELMQLLDEVNDGHQRVFVLGVGEDLNAQLLDRIAGQTRGTRDYVRPGENMEIKLGALVDRISHPVMTELKLAVDGADIHATHPSALADLFQGDHVVVYGRYRKPGMHAIRLAGTVEGVRREFVYEATFAEDDDRHDFLPPLWAERRVAVLLDGLRLGEGDNGELRDEIERLGREFGIVTPYTSHLILEEGDRQRLLGGAPRPGGGGGRGGGPAGPAGPTTGGPAGPATPGPRGPTTGGGFYRGPGNTVPPSGDELFMGSGRARGESDARRHEQLVDELVRAGALPRGTDPQQAREILNRVAGEIAQSQARLEGLRNAQGGRAGVDASVYLAGLIDGRDRGTSLASLFTRRVGGKVFRLRAGRWEDLAWKAPAEPGDEDRTDKEAAPAASAPTRIVAFSEAWFALSSDRPHLAPCLAFSTNMVLVDGDDAFEIVPEPAADADAETGSESDPGRGR